MILLPILEDKLIDNYSYKSEIYAQRIQLQEWWSGSHPSSAWWLALYDAAFKILRMRLKIICIILTLKQLSFIITIHS